MRKKVLISFALFFIFFGLSSCKKDEVEEHSIVDIEISRNPLKLEYTEGETFDPKGMVVKTVYDNDFKVVLDEYNISKTSALSISDTKIDITWNDFTKSVNIQVKPFVEPVVLQDVEIKVTEGYTYTVTEDIGENIQYRAKYSDESVGEWNVVVADDIASVEYNQNTLKMNLEFVLESKKINKSVDVNISNVTLTEVSDIYEKTANDGKTYYLHGIVAALECTMKSASAGEYFIKDMNSDAMIAVQGLCTAAQDTLYNYTEKVKFALGDEVVLPVQYTFVNLSQSSDYKKPLCKYVGSEFIKTAVVSTNNNYRLDHSKAVVISNQEQLQEFLSSTNRLGNYYKLVKLSGDLHYVVYGTSKQHRFFFDETISKNANQYCDGSSPVFMDCNTFYTTGKKFNELMFGGNNYPASNDDYTNQLHSSKDIYCFLAGGNLYYHEFAIVDEEDVLDPTPIKQSTSFVAPTISEYAVGQELNLAGGKIIESYNYKQFSKETTLTTSLIKSSNVNKDAAGDYKVVFTLDGLDYEWNVSYIADIPTKIEVAVAPIKSTYTHRQGINDINLEGGKLLVTNYSGGTELIDITYDMLQKQESPDWKVGVVNYTLTYKTLTCELPITYENKALSVESFLGSDAKDGQQYDLHAIVVGATSSWQTAELVLKSTTSHKLMGIKDLKNLIGNYDSPKLDTDVINVGDEIIIKVTKGKRTGKAEGHILGKGIGTNGADSISSIIILSHNNDTSYDLESAVVIDSQEDLNAFCVDQNRFYTLVKLVDVKAVFYSGRLRIEFEEFENKAAQSINETSPIICQAGCQGIDIYKYWTGINKGKGDDFTSVGTTEYDVYALFITTYIGTSGPVSHTFVVMDESWFVKAR